MLTNSPLTPLIADPLTVPPIVPSSPLNPPLALLAARSPEPLAAPPIATAKVSSPDPSLIPVPLDILALFGLTDPNPRPVPEPIPAKWEVVGLDRPTPIAVPAKIVNPTRVAPIAVPARLP